MALEERERSQRLAVEDPVLALEMGLGRPGKRNARHGGVVDLNHARAREIALIPGIDRETARRIVEVREHLGGRGFSSPLDAATVCELRPDVVDDVQRHAICLPRA